MATVSEDRQATFSPGLAIKQPCRLASTANVAFVAGAPQGLLAIDGVVTVVNDRVLLKNQADATQNGIWVAATGNWVRAPDYDGIRDVAQGTIVLILAGTQAGQIWENTTANPINPGSSTMTFSAIAMPIVAPVAGQVVFGGAGVLAQDANLFWDNTNKRLGIGNAAPTVGLDVTGTIRASTSVVTPLVGTDTAIELLLKTNAVSRLQLAAAGGSFYPSTDLSLTLGVATNRYAGLFTPIIDSGTTGSLSLKTNNGTEQVRVVHTATSVNFLSLQGGAAGNGPFAIATGTDADVAFNIYAKGAGTLNFGGDAGASTQFQILRTASANRNITATGAVGPAQPILGATSSAGVAIVGTATNDNAAAGQYGEFVSTTVLSGASVALATGVSSNVASVTLGAGDWDVSGCIAFTFGATTSYTNLAGGASSATGALPAQQNTFDYETAATVPTAGADMSWVIPTQRFSLSASTTIFLVAQGTFTVSTLKAYGIIRARRVR